MKRTIYYICLMLLVCTLFIYDPNVKGATKRRCQLHGNTLKRDIVPVMSTSLDGTVWEADEEKHFPHAKVVFWVGDYPATAPNEVKEVWYCKKCREVRKRWCKTHLCAP